MKKPDDIIAEILKRADSKKREDIEYEWFDYMKKELKYPFQAEINLISYSSAVSDGDIVKVLDLDNMIDFYGVIMKVKKGGKLCSYLWRNLNCWTKNRKTTMSSMLFWIGTVIID